MKSLQELLQESLLDSYDELDNNARKNYILNTLLSEDKKQHEAIIEFIKTAIKDSNIKRLKQLKVCEFAPYEQWFVRFPGDSPAWEMMLFHCVGSNHWVYYIDKLGNKLTHSVAQWGGSYGLKYNIAVRETEVYPLPQNICEMCTEMEKQLVKMNYKTSRW